MKQGMRMVALSAGLVFAAAGATEAQQHRFDFGVGGGGSWLSSALDDSRLGSDSKVAFNAGWLTNAQATLWFGNRLGVRANFGYSDRALEFDGDDDIITDGSELVRNVNLWTGTGDLMLRLAAPDGEYTGFRMLPYLTGGFGARWVNPAGDDVTVGDETGSTFTLNNQTYALRESREPVWRAGIGTDLRVSRGLSLRLEAGDLIWSAPMDAVTVGPTGAVTVTESDISRTQHEVYGTVGLSFLMGIRDVARVAIAPPPPPPARADTMMQQRRDTVTQQRTDTVMRQRTDTVMRQRTDTVMRQREVEPQQTGEAVTICVADPEAGTTGIERVNAFVIRESGDTLVERNGNRIPLNQAFMTRGVAESQWYVTGQPLSLNAGRERIEFVATGTPMMRDDLTFFGEIDGTPVYVSQQDVQRMGESYQQLRNASGDMSSYLMNNPDAIRVVRDNLTTLYVPVRTIGCEFQELRQMEPVIKR